MKVLLNGKMFIDNEPTGIGNIVKARLSEAIQHTEWYHYNPGFNPAAKTIDQVLGVCGDNATCFLDYMDWNIMNKTEVTRDIYKFLAHRTNIIREGLQNNLIPNHHLDFGGIFNLIDWDFVLDCIGLF